VVSGWGAGWSAGGLVVGVGLEGEVAEEFAGGGGDDADVAVGDEEDDVGSGVGSSDADVAEAAVAADGDGAGGVDAVAAHAPGGVGVAAGRGGFGAGAVGGGGGAAGERPVGAALVVVADEAVEQGARRGRRAGGTGPLASVLGVWWKRSMLPQVLGWPGAEFFWRTPRRRSSVSTPLRPPRPPERRVVRTMPCPSIVPSGRARGEVLGRRDRGSNASSPSAR
jgi:hypothetical protein